jgi:ABC-type long-subunit fatty acid transport system fused permease/ATPase subunit
MNIGNTTAHLRTLAFFGKIFGALAVYGLLFHGLVVLFSPNIAMIVGVALPALSVAYYGIYSTYKDELNYEELIEDIKQNGRYRHD